MKKDLIIKLGIAVGVVVFGYSVFWFFKAGQIEKQLNKFISENSSNISVAELSVSGFPVAQKISVTDLKFSLPTSLFNKKQVLVKSLEAKSSIFSSEFTLSAIGGVSVNDLEKGSMTLEFSKEPEVSFVISGNGITNFSYQDMGYRILDNEKNIFYSAAKSSINIQSSSDEAQKTIFKIVGNISEIQGFNVIDVYKSSLEKKIIEGIKTEQIVMGSSPNLETENLIKAEENKSVDVKSENKNTDIAKAQAGANSTNPSASPAQANAQASDPQNQANAANAQQATDPNKLSPAVASQQVPSTIADSNIVKSNLVIDAEYQVASNQQLAIPSEPNQAQEVSIQSNKVIKINNIEFSNPLYKLLINGQLTIMADDNLPSGGLSLKIENVDSLVDHLVTELGQMANQSKASNPESASADNSSADVSLQDSYKIFLRRIAINLPAVNREISAKNPVSKEKIAQFDIRREKNLDFIINEVSIHEILGKF